VKFLVFMFLLLIGFSLEAMTGKNESQLLREKCSSKGVGLFSFLGKSFISKVQRETYKKNMIISLASGHKPIHAWLNEREEIDVKVNKSLKELKKEKFEYKLKQIPVLSQNDGVSCGAHALKNGMLIARGVGLDGLKDLKDSEVFSYLFGQHKHGSNVLTGFWMQIIIANRSKMVVQNYLASILENKLHLPTNLQVNDKLHGYVTQVWRDVLISLSKKSSQRVIDEGDHNVCCDDVKKELENLSNDTVSTDDEYGLNMQKARTLLKKIDLKELKDIKVPVEKSHIQKAIGSYNENARSRGINPIDLSGGLLDGGELELLINKEHKNGIVLQKPLDVIVIENTELIGNTELGDIYGIEEAKRKIVSGKPVVFAVGTMKHNQESGSGNCGHWFTFVVRPEGMYVADSLSNTNRVDDSRVLKIIEALGLKDIKKDKPKNLVGLEYAIETHIKQLMGIVIDEESSKSQVNLTKLIEQYKQAGGTYQYGDVLQQLLPTK
jgi:hypothetical protein